MKGLGLSFRCRAGGPAACLRALVAIGALPVDRTPTVFTLSGRRETPAAGWFDRVLADPQVSAFVSWEEMPRVQLDVFARSVHLCNADDGYDAESVLAYLAATPFLLAVGGSIFSEWETDWEPTPYLSPHIGDGHPGLGWCMAFQGPGHDEHLVSRRWLEDGPWRLLRGGADTTMVQFHDLDVDEPTARAQAAPGHRLLHNREDSGYLQAPFVYEHEPADIGSYAADARRLTITPGGRDISEGEMRDMAAARAQRGLGEDRPIDTVAYVFDDEARARHYLHALWLRGHEVHVGRGAQTTRLDADYAPPVNEPSWVSG